MEGLPIGPFLLRWNGVFIALGVACGGFISALRLRQRYQDSEIILYLFTPIVVWGWLGARLWHVFTPPLSSIELDLTTTHYLSHPLDILAAWIGGYGIPGALLGGTFGLWLAARKEELPFWQLADILAPGALLAQVIGRVGNYFNQEIYGLPTTLPWGIFIEPQNRLNGFEQIEFYHPLFAYEMILNALALVFLLRLAGGAYAEKLPTGGVFLIYLTVSSAIRFSLEFLRLDKALVNGVNINLIFFTLLFLLAGFLFYKKWSAQTL